MSVSFVFLFLSCFHCYSYAESSSGSQRPVRIMRGELADIKDFPYMLALEKKEPERFQCGAAIIHSSWAITAAHCVSNVSEDLFRLRSGSSHQFTGGTLHDVEKIIIHPNNTDAELSDLAILKVRNPFEFSDVAQPIKLASTTPLAGTEAVVTGWGSDGPRTHQLNKLALHITDLEACIKQYIEDGFGEIVTHDMVCANVPNNDKHVCFGDSGSPLVADKELVGVLTMAGVCGKDDVDGVYMDIAKAYTWINSHISNT